MMVFDGLWRGRGVRIDSVDSKMGMRVSVLCPLVIRRFSSFVAIALKSLSMVFGRRYFLTRPWTRLFIIPGGWALLGGMYR